MVQYFIRSHSHGSALTLRRPWEFLKQFPSLTHLHTYTHTHTHTAYVPGPDRTLPTWNIFVTLLHDALAQGDVHKPVRFFQSIWDHARGPLESCTTRAITLRHTSKARTIIRSLSCYCFCSQPSVLALRDFTVCLTLVTLFLPVKHVTVARQCPLIHQGVALLMVLFNLHML